MITVVRIANPYEPYRRETFKMGFVEGMTTAEACAHVAVDDLVAGGVGHNGMFVANGATPLLRDGDFVMVILCPADYAAVIKFLIQALLVSMVVASLMPKIQEQEDPDSTYSYYGFRNSYTPEGSAVPVVYGTMRFAPPCINQSVIGGGGSFLNSGELIIGDFETLNTMLAISEGPIAGLGDYIGGVGSDGDMNALVSAGSAPNVSEGLKFQVNGIDAQALDALYSWRTGEPYQTPIIGSNGYITYTNPGNTYALNLAITEGTDGIDSTAFPAAVVTYNNRIGGSSSSVPVVDPTQYVSQFLSEKADFMNIQAFFPKGLFLNGETGDPDNGTVKLRVQYWETDSTGTTPVSDVNILQPVVITNNVQRAFSADFRVTLWDTSDILVPAEEGGFLYISTKNSSSMSRVQNWDSWGSLLLIPSVGTSQTWSLCGWIKPHNQNAVDSTPLMVFTDSDNSTDWAYLGMPTDVPGASLKAIGPNATILGGKGFCFIWSNTLLVGINGNNSYPGHCLVLWTWTQRGGYSVRSRWMTDVLEGHSQNTPDWFHIGISYEGNGSDPAEVIAYMDGIAHPMNVTTVTADPNDDNPAEVEPQWFSSSGTRRMYWGSLAGATGDHGDDQTRLYIQGLVLHQSVLRGGFFSTAALGTDIMGNTNFLPSDMEGDPEAKILVDFFTVNAADASSSTGYKWYKNYAFPDAVTQEYGALEVFTNSGSDWFYDAPDSGSQLWTGAEGVPKSAYYQVEVFKEKGDGPFDDFDNQDSTTIDSITSFSTEEYSYPQTAIISTALTASEEINNSTPQLTLIVHGRTVPVWTSGSYLYPTMEEQFSQNPAWIALDMLTNSRYGMGNVFSPEGTYDLIDMQSFKEWADFCDEGAPDGFGYVHIFGLRSDNELESTTNPVGPGLMIYIGLTYGTSSASSSTIQALPETWKVGATISITSCIDSIPDFVTANDTDGGLNNASNRLEIHKISFATATPGSAAERHVGAAGTYVRVDALWNRFTEEGGYVFPEEDSTGYYWWAEDWGVEDNGKSDLTDDITETQTAIEVDDFNLFSRLDFSLPMKHYADIRASVGIFYETETVEVYGVTEGSTNYVNVRRGQLGTTALAADAGNDINLKSRATLATASGYDTRCQFDGVFDQKQSAGWDALLQVFQTGRAMPVKAGARVLAIIDKPKDPVALFTQANILDGSFQISYLGTRDKPNSLTAKFLDRDRNFEANTVVVDHPSTWGGAGSCSINTITDKETCQMMGGIWTADDFNPQSYPVRRSETLEARGVTRRAQVTRDATYRLNRYYLQRRSAKFDVGPDAIHLLPGDRILVSHDTPQYGYSGRIPDDSSTSNLFPSGGPNTTAPPNLYEAFSVPGDQLSPSVSTQFFAGGPVWKSGQSLATTIQPSAIVPPITTYSTPVTMFRNSVMASGGVTPAGLAASGFPVAVFDNNKGGTGYFTTWTSAVGYPSDNDILRHGVDIDVIESATHKSCWSVYVKEPAKGASRGFLINMYRRYNSAYDNATNQSYYGYFRWEGGVLVTVGSAATGVTHAVDDEYSSAGWYRASVTIDWSAITDITPAEAVGWHMQPRIYLYDYQDNGDGGFNSVPTFYGLFKGYTKQDAVPPITWNDDGTTRRGRGSNWLAYGDPLKINNSVWSQENGWYNDPEPTTIWARTEVDSGSGSPTANYVWGLASTPPPFYPESYNNGDEEMGKYGYVHGFYGGKTGAANYMALTQVLYLNARTNDVDLVGGPNWAWHFDRFNGRNSASWNGDMSDEPMVLSFFFKKLAVGSVDTQFEARLMFTNKVDGNDPTNKLYASVVIGIPSSGADPTFTFSLNNTGSTGAADLHWAQYSGTPTPTTYTGDAVYAEKVRQNSTDTDGSWYYVRMAAYCDENFRHVHDEYTSHLGCQFIVGAPGGASTTTYAGSAIWGVTLRGLGGDSKIEGDCTTNVLYYTLDNTGRHRGLNFWGPMYETGVSSPSAFLAGSSMKLDRDVSVDAGSDYEIYVRSSTSTDPVLATDDQQVMQLSSSEIPSSGSRVIPARTAIECSAPTKLLPATGDVYSFGKSGQSVEDFSITNIETDPNTLVRSIECVEYDEQVYNDINWGTIGDPTVSNLPPAGSGSEPEYAMGGGGGGVPEGLNLRVHTSGYRGASGVPVAGVWLQWTHNQREKAFAKARIFISQLDATPQDNGASREAPPQLIATLPGSAQEYRYDGPALNPSRTYRIRFQPVGRKGTARALRKCPSIDIPPVVTPPLPSAPTVAATLHGKKQMYKVAQTGAARDYAIEGRIGGWIVSTPGWIIDPNTDRFISEGLLPVPTNAAGVTQASIYARPKLLNGSYGKVTTVLGTEVMVDVRATASVIAEDNYTAVGAIVGSELQIVAGTTETLRWDPAKTATTDIYRLTAVDAGAVRRTVVNAIIEGYQERPETFADFGENTLGSEIGRNWSIEGPMKDDGYNGTVEIQWMWSSTSSLSGLEWRPFEPGEIYARKMQFQLVFTRAAIEGLEDGTGYAQTNVTRFTVVTDDQPAEHFVDGGTF